MKRIFIGKAMNTISINELDLVSGGCFCCHHNSLCHTMSQMKIVGAMGATLGAYIGAQAGYKAMQCSAESLLQVASCIPMKSAAGLVEGVHGMAIGGLIGVMLPLLLSGDRHYY